KPVTRCEQRTAHCVSAAASAGRGPAWRTDSSDTRQPSDSAEVAVSARVQPGWAREPLKWFGPGPAGRHSASFGRRVSSRVIRVSQGFAYVLGAIERQHRRLVVHHRLQVDRAAPYEL